MNIRAKTKEGIFWIFFFNGFHFLFRFAGSIVLARILFPEDFGFMAIVMIVMQLARRLTNFGFTMVLVQRKNVETEHFQTVFLCNLFLMGFLTAVIFFGSGYTSRFFDNSKIEPLLEIVAFVFVLQSFSGVSSAILKRSLRFKELEFSDTISSLIETCSSIGFAFLGCGAHSLVYGILLKNFSLIILTWYYTGWIPNFKFHFSALRDVFSFGLWVYIASYINYAINQVDFFLIGKFLNATQLGFYERSFNIMRLPVNQIAMKIESILFSSFSRVQDEKDKVVEAMLQLVNYFSLISYFLMTWMFFASPSLINVLYGSKWAPSVRPLQIMCIAGVVQTITLIFSPVLISQGLIGKRARWSFIYLLVLTSLVALGMNWGIIGVSCSVTLASFVQLFLMLNLAAKHLKFSFRSFFKAQRSAAIYSSILFLVLTFSTHFLTPIYSIDSWQMLMTTIVVTFISLFSTHFFLRFEDIETIICDLKHEIIARAVPFLKTNLKKYSN